MIRVLLILVALVVLSCGASAQNGIGAFDNSPPTVGASDGAQIPATPHSFGASTGPRVHRDFTGQPCLEVGGYAQPHVIDPTLYDHIITVLNRCPQRIALEVCYYQSQDCIPMQVPGDERKDAVLGTMPSEKDFRFEFREKF
jgi:hypothetical protein